MPIVTFNPSYDGCVYQKYSDGHGVAWATIIAAAGSGWNTGVSAYFSSDNAVGHPWLGLYRAILIFDTSSLPLGATVTSATLSLYDGSNDGLNMTPDVNLYSVNPAHNNSLVATDYSTFGTQEFCDTFYAHPLPSGYNDFEFNWHGLLVIDPNGFTKIGIRNANYDVLGIAPTWKMQNWSGFVFSNRLTAHPPKLTITYTVSTVLYQENWKIYQDDAPEPTIALAAENTKPTLVNSDLIRLRTTIKNLALGAGTYETSLQWSTNPAGPWNDMAQEDPTALWDYAEGKASGGDQITGFLTTDGNNLGTYHELSSYPQDEIYPVAESYTEMDFAIKPIRATFNTTYYFRCYCDGQGIDLDTAKSYPSVTTQNYPTSQFLTNAIEITPATTGSWQDVDLSGYIPTGTSGVILRVVNENSFSDKAFGIRKKGSADDRKDPNGLYAQYHTFMYIGVDASRFIQAYVPDQWITIWLQGWFYTDDAVFFDDGVDKSIVTEGAWTEIDCGGDVPAGAIVLMFEGYAAWGDSPFAIGMRKKGSTDNRTNGTHRHLGILVGCDVDRKVEAYTDDDTRKFYLVGYIKSGRGSFNTDGIDIGGSAVGWQLETVATPGAGVLVELCENSFARADIREYGSTDDFWDPVTHGWFLVGIDASFQYEYESSGVEIYEMGYIGVPPLPIPTNSELMRHLQYFHNGINYGCYKGSR